MTDISVNKRLLIGVTGSIAAYKAAEIARLFVSRGFEVRTVMTEAAQKFLTPMTMQAVTGGQVTTSFWEGTEVSGIGHIQLADWADAFLIAPASADCIAKLAAGIADSPLYAIALATRAPILVAPAMNMNMYDNPVTQENLDILRSRGVTVIDAEEGALACGWNGTGRLADPWEIFFCTLRALSKGDFAGKHVLITSGPTREAIDSVRFISNRSSGKMGIALAREVYRRGGTVTLVHGPISVHVPRAVRCVPVVSAEEMRDAVQKETSAATGSPDVVIMVAAVADVRPAKVVKSKIKKAALPKALELAQNPDILAEVGAARGTTGRPVLVGFAVETGEVEDLLAEAHRKLIAKNLDLIVANLADDALEQDTNRVWILDRHGKQHEVSATFKSRIANRILDVVGKQ